MQAFNLAFSFWSIAIAPIVACSLIVAVVRKQADGAAIITMVFDGAIWTAICASMMFLGCSRRWRAEGSRLSRRRVWPFAILFVIVAYGLPFLPIPYAHLNWTLGEWLAKAWITTMLLWPFCFGLLSRYFLLVEKYPVE
jgi:hypothetical protein